MMTMPNRQIDIYVEWISRGGEPQLTSTAHTVT